MVVKFRRRFLSGNFSGRSLKPLIEFLNSKEGGGEKLLLLKGRTQRVSRRCGEDEKCKRDPNKVLMFALADFEMRLSDNLVLIIVINHRQISTQKLLL